MTNENPIELVTESGWRQRKLGRFADRLGPLWTRNEDGALAYGVLPTEDHLNPAGFVHGGVFCALFDHTTSAIAWEAVGRRACVTVQLNTQFLAAAREGQFLEARGKVVRLTKTLAFVEARISTGSDELLRGSAVLKIMS